MKSARLALWLLALWALGVPSGFSPARAQEAQPYWCDLCEGERGRHSDGCPTRPAAKRLPRLDLAALAAQRARAASAAGDREQAAAGYRELVRLRPQSASAWNNLGNALWGLKRLAEAGRAYEESFARRPAGHARGNLARLLRARRARDRLVLRAAALDEARAHYAAGQHLAAIEALGLIPRPDPHVWQFIGQAQARLGRYPAAVAACELALAESPLTAERRARLEADREAWAAREGALYDRVLARGALAEAKDLLGRGRSAPARDLLERLVRAQPNHRVAHDRLGLLLLGRRRLRDAVWAEAAFRRSVSLEPDLSATWTNLGVLYDRLGQPRRALVSYRRALVLDATRETIRARVALLEARAVSTASLVPPSLEQIASGAVSSVPALRPVPGPAPVLVSRLPVLSLEPLLEAARQARVHIQGPPGAAPAFGLALVIRRTPGLAPKLTLSATDRAASAAKRLRWLQREADPRHWPELSPSAGDARPLDLDGPRGWLFVPR